MIASIEKHINSVDEVEPSETVENLEDSLNKNVEPSQTKAIELENNINVSVEPSQTVDNLDDDIFRTTLVKNYNNKIENKEIILFNLTIKELR